YFCSAIVLFDEEQEPTFVATAGFEDNNFDLVEEYKTGKAMPCREKALNSSSPVIEDYREEKCEECLLVEKCKSGRAVMVRLGYEEKIYGLMTVFVPDKFSNLDEELDLLQEAAGDLGFAFSSLEAQEELARTEENLRVTFDSVGDGLISTDTDGRVVRMNSVAEELTGWSSEEAGGEPLAEVFEIVNSNSGKTVKNPAEKVLATDKVVELGNDTTLISRDGSEYQIANSGAPIKKADDEIIGVVMVFRDISEKYKLQEKIKRSEKRYRSLFSRMNEGMALHEIVHNEAGEPVDYKILDVNSKFEEILDLDKEQVVGRKATEVYESEQPPYFERYLEVVREDKTLDFETYYPPADKHFHISVFSPEKGKFATIFLDITDRVKIQEALEESEQHYRRLFETAQDGMLIVDASSGEIKDANPFIHEILGYAQEELVGKKLWNIGTFQDVVENHQRFEELIDRGYIRYEDLPLEDKSGREVPVEFVSNTYKAGDDEVLQCNIRDISQRKEAEERFKESHRQLQTLFGNLPGIAYRCLYDEDWTMQFISEGCRKLTGYQSDELLDGDDLSYNKIIHPEDREKVRREVQSGVNNDEPFEMVYRIKTRGGEIKWVREQGEGVFDEEGEVEFLEGLITDVTEREQVKIKLQAEKKFLNQILETSPVGIVVFNHEGTIEQVNERALDIFNRSESEVIGLSYDAVDWQAFDETGESIEVEKLPFNEVMKTGEAVYNREFGICQPDEAEMWLSVSMAPVRNEQGKITRTIAAMEDITRRREIENKLRASLEEKDTMLQEIHHRVKNNLQVICSLLDMQKQQADEEAQKALSDAHSRVYSMALVHENIYRTESLAEIEIQDYLEKLIDLIEQSQGEVTGDIQINQEIDPEITLQLETAIPCALILNELISNAYEHAFSDEQEDPRVSVSFERMGAENNYDYL
ncbi:MAG: PAS domain S-box protein, partial [bacterium]